AESCDEGGVDTRTCDFDCTAVECGDEHHNAQAEFCDEGGVDTRRCDSDCTRVECGDSHRNEAADEECDDGNRNNNDNCLATCVPNTCGDGYVDLAAPRVEDCGEPGLLPCSPPKFCNSDCQCQD
ncbi:MAG: proteoliaisin, partial [Proteobacteria bacterium]|nr:proteoliaisin [Pseudomonadota bacterium]